MGALYLWWNRYIHFVQGNCAPSTNDNDHISRKNQPISTVDNLWIVIIILLLTPMVLGLKMYYLLEAPYEQDILMMVVSNPIFVDEESNVTGWKSLVKSNTPHLWWSSIVVQLAIGVSQKSHVQPNHKATSPAFLVAQIHTRNCWKSTRLLCEKKTMNHRTRIWKRNTMKHLPGWWFEPLWKILVNWDDYSQ